MKTRVTPFLMFAGQAEAAMNFYVALFPEAQVTGLTRYGPNEAGAEGSVYQASFTVAGQAIRCFDSPVKHAFSFTPSISLFVDCVSEEEQQRLFAALSAQGMVMMELADYGFSRKFAWVSDRFGVSWQLNLPYARDAAPPPTA